MRILFPTAWLAVFLSGGPARGLEIASPDAGVKFLLNPDERGHLRYAVQAAGRTRLEPARAGILVDGRDLGAGVELGTPATRQVFETFAWRGHKARATNHCTVAEIPVRLRDGGPAWTLEARVFNDGAAFRYRVPGEGNRRIAGETTTWQLPADATLWLQTDTDDYEGVYHARRADQVPLEEKAGEQTRAVHLGPPVTVVYPDGGYGLITEAALFRYSGLTLRPEGGARFRAAFEDDPDGWDHAGPIVSPWRVIVLTHDLNGLVNSDVIPALCDPPDPELFPEGMNTSWLRPGKAPCTWMVFGNDGAQWDKQRWFVDMAAARLPGAGLRARHRLRVPAGGRRLAQRALGLAQGRRRCLGARGRTGALRRGPRRGHRALARLPRRPRRQPRPDHLRGARGVVPPLPRGRRAGRQD